MNHKEFFERLPKEYTPAERNKIEQAYHVSKTEFMLEKRDGGERYFNHCRRVALLLMKYYRPPLILWSDNVIIALLHDVLEDCWPPENMLKDLFGKEVNRGVLVLSKLIPVYDKNSGYARTKTKLDVNRYLEAISLENSVLGITKMADRLDNIKTMNNVWPKKRQLKYVKETELMLNIFHEKFQHSAAYYDLKRELDNIKARLT